MTTAYTVRTDCRVCGSRNLSQVLDLGAQYVSDFPPPGKATDGPCIPIVLDLCRDCSLVQARCTPPPDLLYRKHYWYRSGVTETMRQALKDVAQAATRVANLQAGDVVLDIGSNDGTLLRYYDECAPGVIKVGVEPAENLWEEGSRGVDGLIRDFWSAEAFLRAMQARAAQREEYTKTRAKVVTACGMFYDLDDPNQFIADVAKVLHPEGVFVAQLMCLKQTLEKKDVGNFAHEHLEFYSLISLDRLLTRHGLEVFDLEENKVNGGSYRVYARHKGLRPYPQGSVGRMAQRYRAEEVMGLDRPATYTSFFQELERGKAKVVDFIRQAVADGKRVWVYGASTKGNVILQYYGLGHEQVAVFRNDWSGEGHALRHAGNTTLIEAAADRSPEKWGRVTAGTGIPIVSEEEFRKAAPDYALVLPYAFLEEFVAREEQWLLGGGKFIVPLPEPMVVGTEGTWVTRNPL